MSSERIRTEVSDRVATITMDDPERMNPLDREAYRSIIDGLDDAEAAGVRCVVLEGAGDAFSSGFDVDAMGDTYESMDRHIEVIQEHEHELVHRIAEFPLPVVGKIDGPAVGDAAGIAIACDIPLASERAKIGFSHIRFGMTLDCGVSFFLPRMVGEGLAKELALTGDIVDAETAREYGLVNHVFDLDEFEAKADRIVQRIANGPPIALRHSKRLLAGSLDTCFEETLHKEATAQAVVTDSEDYEEGINAISDGRDPHFTGR